MTQTQIYRILDEIGTLSTVPGQNRDEKVGMVHGRLAYMRQVAVRSRDGARRTPSTTIVEPARCSVVVEHHLVLDKTC